MVGGYEGLLSCVSRVSGSDWSVGRFESVVFDVEPKRLCRTAEVKLQ